MRKSLICGLVSLAVVVLCSCSTKNAPDGKKSVSFELLGLDVSNEAMAPSRAAGGEVSPSAAGVTDIWVMEGTALLCHQVSTDADFGTPTIALDYGQHSLTFIASGQTGQSVSNGVFMVDNAKECFGTMHSLDVSAATGQQAVVLSRVCYGLKWQSLDVIPDGVEDVKVEVAQYRGSIDYSLGGVSPQKKTVTHNVASRVGSTVSVTVFGFPEANDESCNISTTITFCDADGVVLYQWQKTVPVWANRTTKISGNLFSGHADAAMSVNTAWGDDYAVSL